MPPLDVVITGIGVFSPIGIGKETVWEGFCQGRNGVGRFEVAGLNVHAASTVGDFDPKKFVKPRKNLKVMLRDAQLGVAASILAARDAGIEDGTVDPERFGVVLGADKISAPTSDSEQAYRQCAESGEFDFDRWGPDGIPEIFPLSFLRLLPNMIASHISIAHDARGPCNTIHQAEVSGLLAVGEATRVIQRGASEVMLAGGASSTMTAYDWVSHCGSGRLSQRQEDPDTFLRPFDADRHGEVRGEGAAVFVLESRSHAEARGAPILARVLGCTSASEKMNGRGFHGAGLRRSMDWALKEAGLDPSDVGHVNAHGLSSIRDDAVEAEAIHDVLPGVPVTAPKSFFGNLGAGGGAVELVASVMAVGSGKVPPTRNYVHPDPKCPVAVIRDAPREVKLPTALSINFTGIGQATALVLGEPG